MKQPKFKLDPKEVTSGESGSMSAKPGNFSRSTQERTIQIYMTHVPTGITLQSEFGPAFLSKTKWKLKRQEMRDIMFNDLEKEVARKLHK